MLDANAAGNKLSVASAASVAGRGRRVCASSHIRARGVWRIADRLLRLRRHSVRCRTDCDRGSAQTAFKPERAVEHEVTSRSSVGRAVRKYIREPPANRVTKGNTMLYTIALLLLILWALGLVTSYTVGGFIHLLLVIALVMVVISFISGRRAL